MERTLKTDSRKVDEKYEVFIIGEQLRQRMHADPSQVIKDRKYYFRTYKTCFEGRDAIDWVLRTKQLKSRQVALSVLSGLHEYGVLHHVCDEHALKDESLFYRFRRDDNTHLDDVDLDMFYRGYDLYQKLTIGEGNLLQTREERGQRYNNVFLGCDFIGWLVGRQDVCSRGEAVVSCRDLLERNIIKHVTDDYHFRDEELLYRFTLDYTTPRAMSELLRFKGAIPHSKSGNTLSVETDIINFGDIQPMKVDYLKPDMRATRMKSRRVSVPANVRLYPSQHAVVEEDENCGDENISQNSKLFAQPRTLHPALFQHPTIDELEDPDSDYTKQRIYVEPDSIGYGVVIRGEGPTFIQAVDPQGPGAAAGLRRKHYIYSVNGVNVLREEHRAVAKLVFRQCVGVLFVVMSKQIPVLLEHQLSSSYPGD